MEKINQKLEGRQNPSNHTAIKTGLLFLIGLAVGFAGLAIALRGLL